MFTHLFLNTDGDGLHVSDESGRVVASSGWHGSTGLVHLQREMNTYMTMTISITIPLYMYMFCNVHVHVLYMYMYIYMCMSKITIVWYCNVNWGARRIYYTSVLRAYTDFWNNFRTLHSILSSLVLFCSASRGGSCGFDPAVICCLILNFYK